VQPVDLRGGGYLRTSSWKLVPSWVNCTVLPVCWKCILYEELWRISTKGSDFAQWYFPRRRYMAHLLASYDVRAQAL